MLTNGSYSHHVHLRGEGTQPRRRAAHKTANLNARRQQQRQRVLPKLARASEDGDHHLRHSVLEGQSLNDVASPVLLLPSLWYSD